MENFTPISAFAGGLMIGGAAIVLLLFNGRVAGISGIAGGLLAPMRGDALWRIVFLVGLAVGPVLYSLATGEAISIDVTSSVPALIIGGFLVGFGSSAGSGCTSGHGVCGLARFSKRSLVATATFMAAALITVYLTRHVFGVLS
jgi:uncharacterized protein